MGRPDRGRDLVPILMPWFGWVIVGVLTLGVVLTGGLMLLFWWVTKWEDDDEERS